MTTAPEASTPAALAADIAELRAPRLIVFDCDGVLAPLVDHADDARLSPGTGPALARLAASADTEVAILSGRSLAGLEQFGFDTGIDVLGSYGAERRGRDHDELDPARRELLHSLGELASSAAAAAGAGAWVEEKPASVVLHVREADSHAGDLAVRRTRDAAERLHGVFVHEGKAVVELAVHGSDKGSALLELVDEIRPASVVYLGDDHPDEAAFAAIRRGPLPGIGVKVGPSDTGATHRLADPAAVTRVIELLAGLD